MATREFENAAALVAAVGQELGVSDWPEVHDTNTGRNTWDR